MSSNVIYGLVDPNSKELRYIGYSCQLDKRLKQHFQLVNLKKNTHKNNWIKSLIIKNQIPEIIILEEYNFKDQLPQAEIEIIEYFKFIGANLVNATKGGDGTFGRIVSLETRNKMSAILLGRKKTPKAIENWKKANKGKPSPNKGNKASLELKKKLSLSHIGIQGKKKILTDQQEIDIINEFNIFNITKVDLAKKYGVSRDTIFRIFKRNKNRMQ